MSLSARLIELLRKQLPGGGETSASSAQEMLRDGVLQDEQRERLEIDRQEAVRLFGGGNHPAAFLHGGGHGFLDNDMEAGPQRSQDDLGMGLDARRHVNGIELLLP